MMCEKNTSYGRMSLADMRKELKDLRKSAKENMPVSRMKKGDISAELERLRGMRETTTAPAAVPSTSPRKMASKCATVKESKMKEHPIAPEKKKKGMSKSTLMALLNEMSSDEE